MTAKWIQCTSVSNECLGGCCSMAEHDRYRNQSLVRLTAHLRAENDALRAALHEAVLQVIREAMPRKEGEE